MLKSGALKSSRGFDLPSCFTFWDMDDTCINTKDNTLKNPHLLLPIMLYQSVSRNQNFGICTNRAPNDVEGCYPVAQFIKDMSQFGIDLPISHVIYGGGLNNAKFSDYYHDLQKTIEALTLQLQAIELTETAQHIRSGLDHIKHLVLKDPSSPAHDDANKSGVAFLGAQIERAGYLGKNFHINEFLKERYDIERKGFLFEGHFFSEDELVCGMVDDRSEIASPDILAPLGKNYFGIKASDGGNPPKTKSLIGDYYQDEYLFTLAKRIGLEALSEHFLKNKDTQCDPRLHMASFLYGWQKNPETCTLDMLAEALYKMNLKQCDQTVAMLVAIDKQANRHSDAHYHDVSKLLVVANSIASEKYLDCAYEKILKVRSLIDVERKRIQADSVPATKSDSDLMRCDSRVSDKKKSKFSFGFRKSSASLNGSDSSISQLDQPVVEELKSVHLNALLLKETSLTERLVTLSESPRSTLSKSAHKVVERLNERSDHSSLSQSSHTYLPSRTQRSGRADVRQIAGFLKKTEEESVQISSQNIPALKSKCSSTNEH